MSMIWHLNGMLSATFGILTLFIGMSLNKRIKLLRTLTIPEPVTGGLFAAIIVWLMYQVLHFEISFTLTLRDILLLYFFTTIGLNAQISEIRKGGKLFAILLALSILYIILQDAIGITVAWLIGDKPISGLLGSSVSLIGGHGTAIAWAPTFKGTFKIENALELGIASASIGIVLASIIGGPIAKYLIKKHDLSGSEDVLDFGAEETKLDSKVSFRSFLDALLAINVCIIIGEALFKTLHYYKIDFPLFVCSLFSAIVLSNLAPYILPKRKTRRILSFSWPRRTQAIALIADLSLGVFLAMSLMSMQLWKLVDASSLIIIIFIQLIIAILYILFFVFRAMGSDYTAAVICAGFGGISLGATPTAIANMTAVIKQKGSAHMAFIVLPLVSAFFLDIINALMISGLMAYFQ